MTERNSVKVEDQKTDLVCTYQDPDSVANSRTKIFGASSRIRIVMAKVGLIYSDKISLRSDTFVTSVTSRGKLF